MLTGAPNGSTQAAQAGAMQNEQARRNEAKKKNAAAAAAAANSATTATMAPAPQPQTPQQAQGNSAQAAATRQGAPAYSTQTQAQNGVTSYGLFANPAPTPGAGGGHGPITGPWGAGPPQIMPPQPPTNPFNMGDIVNGSTGEAWYPGFDDTGVHGDVPLQGGKIGQNQTAGGPKRALAQQAQEQQQQAQVGAQAQSKPGGKGNRGGPIDIDGDGQIAWWEEGVNVIPTIGAIRGADVVAGRLLDDPRDPDGDGFDSDGRKIEDPQSPVGDALGGLSGDLGGVLADIVNGFQDGYDGNGNQVGTASDYVDSVFGGMGQFNPGGLTDSVLANWQQAMGPEAWQQQADNQLATRYEDSLSSLNESERRLNARSAQAGIGNDTGMREGLYNDFAGRNQQAQRDVFNDALNNQMTAMNGATTAANANRSMDQSLYSNELSTRNAAAMSDWMKEVEDNPSAMAILRDLMGAGGQAMGAAGDMFGSAIGAGGSALGGGGLAALLGAIGM